jgi:DNA-binding LytR/AlgR family response regulator
MDIKMPGQTGIEAAEELAERWEGPAPFPHVVFVTAYDDYAVQAFEQAAADYVLKPVNETRLARTVERLQGLLARREGGREDRPDALCQPDGGSDPLSQLVQRLQALMPASPAPERLDFVRAAVGNLVRMIPVSEVVYFQAADKYVNVATREHEALIRVPLKELLPQLDPSRFRQVNRSTVVNMACVESAGRDSMGKVMLILRGRPEKPRVSPVYAHLFRQM